MADSYAYQFVTSYLHMLVIQRLLSIKIIPNQFSSFKTKFSLVLIALYHT